MNEVMMINGLDELKTRLNYELNQAAQSFVRIGWLLKAARDTDILKDSPYSDVNEFAAEEFGLDKSQVSRFMRINDRFSIDGNSDELEDKYKSYGSAKLSLMLTLPDEINEELSPELSKTDIQAIKEEYEEEQKVTDLEVMMEEQPEGEPDEFIALVVKHLNDEHQEPARLAKECGDEINADEAKEYYMPDGDQYYNIRIPGQGKFMIAMKEEQITITNMRAPAEKSTLGWDEFAETVKVDVKERKFEAKKETKEAPKPKKVEKSKPKEEKKTAPAAYQPAEPVEVWNEENKEAAGEPEIMPKPEETTEAAGEEIDEVQKAVLDELNVLKEQIEKKLWHAANETVQDLAQRIKSKCL